MILNRIGDKFEYEGLTYVIGAPIVGTPESEYEGLYGTITEIRDGEDKETENETPDLYCSFRVPALPYEAKKLEKVFSDLYQQPKTIDDIILDFVILAPPMVEPLDDLKKCRHYPRVCILLEDWAIDGRQGNSFEVYTDLNDAKRIMAQRLEEEQETGCISRWVNQKNFRADSIDTIYECYIDGEYCENHYHIAIAFTQLCVSNRFARVMAKIYNTSCLLEDFVSQTAGRKEPDKLTDEQYDRMVRDTRFSERLHSALWKNESYREACRQTVSAVAHEFVDEYLKGNAHPDCYTPEQDNPYPLCIGNGSRACGECCLYAEKGSRAMETLNTRIICLYRNADNHKMHNEHKDQYTACGNGVYRLNCRAA